VRETSRLEFSVRNSSVEGVTAVEKSRLKSSSAFFDVRETCDGETASRKRLLRRAFLGFFLGGSISWSSGPSWVINQGVAVRGGMAAGRREGGREGEGGGDLRKLTRFALPSLGLLGDASDAFFFAVVSRSG